MNPRAQELLGVALRAAEKASEFIWQESRRIREVDFKGATDLVTQADRGSERIILDEIDGHFPDHNVLTEESAGRAGNSQFTWIVDPLDGTTNFVHGYPFYAVSIAVYKNDRPLVAVVVDVVHRHTYSAIGGSGAFRNEKRIGVAGISELKRALLATGFPYIHDEIWSRNFEHFRKFTNLTQGVRRAGAAAIDLAHVACGWLDGFWEYGLHPWDTAAGVLIVQEAGGTVSKADGSNFSILDRDIVASNGHLHEVMLEVLSSSNR